MRRWLDEPALDAELEAPLSKARGEFEGRTEKEARAVWAALRQIIDTWVD